MYSFPRRIDDQTAERERNHKRHKTRKRNEAVSLARLVPLVVPFPFRNPWPVGRRLATLIGQYFYRSARHQGAPDIDRLKLYMADTIIVATVARITFG